MTKPKSAAEKFLSDYPKKPKADPEAHVANHPRRDRSRTPLESFNPEMINWLREASEGEVRLKPTTPEERRRVPQRMIRIRELKVRMVEEGHPLANQVAGVSVSWACECGRHKDLKPVAKREAVCNCGQGEILLRRKDGDLSALKATFVKSLEMTPKSEFQLAKEAKLNALVEDLIPKSTPPRLDSVEEPDVEDAEDDGLGDGA